MQIQMQWEIKLEQQREPALRGKKVTFKGFFILKIFYLLLEKSKTKFLYVSKVIILYVSKVYLFDKLFLWVKEICIWILITIKFEV